MQRRLAIALVLTALVTVVLVGFGILAMAQRGARARATDDVVRGLGVLESVVATDAVRPGQLQALAPDNRRNLGLDLLEPVVIGPEGQVYRLGRARAQRRLNPVADLSVSADQLALLDDGETVVISQPDQVVGLVALPPDLVRVEAADARTALLAIQPVTAVPRQTVLWFLSSSVVVLIGALVAGLLLARRLVHPIRNIQGATAAIAAGQLTTRIEVDGDDELAELGRSVNAMAADLERSKALDQQFLLSVSHDLRTPLTAIAGYAEALRDGAVDDPGGAGEVIGNHAARLDRLVRDLLDLARLDANRFQLDLRPVDFEVVVGRTAAGLAPEAAKQGVTIEQRRPDGRPGTETAVVDGTSADTAVRDRTADVAAAGDGTTTERTSDPIVVLADADRLAQAVGNLIDNAITFAARSIAVEVTVGVDAGGSPMATVAVADDGPGFDPDDLPFVFDRLYTGRTRPRRAESPTGLGLAIVRELAGAMGGSVRAGNSPSGGARIELSLPMVDGRGRPGATDRSAETTVELPTPEITPAGEPPRRADHDRRPSGPPGPPEPSPSA